MAVGVSMWRDPLDELIEDLEHALPSAPARYQFLPRLEDLQAVISPILFGTEEEQERLLADPNYQRLSERVMRQLHESLSHSREPAACPDNSTESKTGARSVPLHSTSAARPRESAALHQDVNLICICDADEDGEHAPDCPLTVVG
jgi:hypothetical protein